MRRIRTLALGLITFVSFPSAARADGDPGREIVVGLAPAPPARRAALESGLAQRAAARGWTIARRFDDGLPPQRATPFGPPPAADRVPLDPSRILLISVPDARAALAQL